MKSPVIWFCIRLIILTDYLIVMFPFGAAYASPITPPSEFT